MKGPQGIQDKHVCVRVCVLSCWLVSRNAHQVSVGNPVAVFQWEKKSFKILIWNISKSVNFIKTINQTLTEFSASNNYQKNECNFAVCLFPWTWTHLFWGLQSTDLPVFSVFCPLICFIMTTCWTMNAVCDDDK